MKQFISIQNSKNMFVLVSKLNNLFYFEYNIIYLLFCLLTETVDPNRQGIFNNIK